MANFGKCVGGGRRSAERQYTPLMAVFTTLVRSHAAVLVDISCTGARLHGEDLPEAGEELLLTAETVRAFGTVVWVDRGQCGIAFDEALHPDEVRALRGRVAAGLSPEMKAALEDWTVGLAR